LPQATTHTIIAAIPSTLHKSVAFATRFLLTDENASIRSSRDTLMALHPLRK
uniref:Dimer_Tnp_hAT domain-containing protein n=1 Tax=Steinernema glaseri TaxID=37863 RepID=A0A1I8AC44_9BILA